MWFYLSENETFNDFGNEAALVWHETNIPYAIWAPESTRSLSLKYYPSEVYQLYCEYISVPVLTSDFIRLEVYNCKSLMLLSNN